MVNKKDNNSVKTNRTYGLRHFLRIGRETHRLKTSGQACDARWSGRQGCGGQLQLTGSNIWCA